MPLKLQIFTADAAKWKGWCAHRLIELTGLRKALRISELIKTYSLPGNIVAQIISSDICDIIRIWGGLVAGFLCYPHSGDKTLGTFNGSLGSEFHRHIGSIAFPLIDDDGGTAQVNFDEAWQAELNVDAENYGNIDWIGNNTAGDGELSNAPVLTWRGPPTRHVLKTVDVQRHIPGFTHYEETVESSGFPVDIYTAFSPYIYQGGEVLATAPPVSSPNDLGDGFGNLALILGAALTYDATGGEWLVCISGVNKRLAGGGFEYHLYARSGNSDLLYSEDNPGGWVKLADYPTSRPTSCWFFNASGTEAQCVQGPTRLKINIDIDSKIASFISTPNDNVLRKYLFGANGNNYDNSPSGSPPEGYFCKPVPSYVSDWDGVTVGGSGDSSLTFTESGEWVAGIEYKGDVEVPIIINHSVEFAALTEGEFQDTYKVLDAHGHFDGPPGIRLVSWDDPPGNPTNGVFSADNICVDHWSTTLGSISSSGELTILCSEKCFGPSEVGSVTVTVTDNAGNTYEITHDVNDCGGTWVSQLFTGDPPTSECTCTDLAYCKCSSSYALPVYLSPTHRVTLTGDPFGVSYFISGQLLIPSEILALMLPSTSCGSCDPNALIWICDEYTDEVWTCS